MKTDEVTKADSEIQEEAAKEKPNKKKVKKTSSLIKKFKIKSKSTSTHSVPTESSFSDKPSTSEILDSDDKKLVKAISDTNITESCWKSAENLSTEDTVKASCKSIIQIESTDISVTHKDGSGYLERTKSLENIQAMPAFGDLIYEPTTSMSTQNSTKQNKDYLYKILVIGDLGTGKTSIIKRYVHQFFSQHYRATIGVDFALKVLHWDANTVIRLQLWDIAGQERYGNMTRVYYKEAVGAFIVFDVTRSNTFESVANWKSDLDTKVQLSDGTSIPCVLLANKCDQQKEGIVNSPAKMDEYCQDKGFTSWFETSAKENINIEEAARSLISKILQNDVLLNSESNKDKEQFSLTSKNGQNGNKESTCFKC